MEIISSPFKKVNQITGKNTIKSLGNKVIAMISPRVVAFAA